MAGFKPHLVLTFVEENVQVKAGIHDLCRHLTGNQLRCDCSAAWMKDFDPMKSPSAGSVVCAGPGPLAGRKLESVPLGDFNCGQWEYSQLA